MKRLLIICAICGAFTSLHAQTESDAIYANKLPAKSNNEVRITSSKKDILQQVEISVDQRLITFSGLPSDRKVWALITDAEGASVKGVKMSPADNVIDVHKLHSGMYFVTLVYRDANKKAFVIHL